MRIGTRGSKLAMIQAEKVTGLLENQVQTQIVKVQTQGDQDQLKPLREMGTVGVFTKALDDALISGEVDLAVHSAKDLLSTLHQDLKIVAVLKRDLPNDVFIAKSEEISLENMNQSFVIGTSSVRREAFLKHYFPNHTVKNIRGNVETRIQKMQDGEYDAILLSYAGLLRMNLTHHISKKLNTSVFVPAAGQGSIVIVMKKGHPQTETVRELCNDLDSEVQLKCERSFLRTLGGGCSIPSFALASTTVDTISLDAGLASYDGKKILRKQIDAPIEEAEKIGEDLAQYIINQGGNTLI